MQAALPGPVQDITAAEILAPTLALQHGAPPLTIAPDSQN